MIILQKKVAGLSAPSLGRFVLRARRAAGLRGAVNVLVTGNSAMRALHWRFCGKAKATDVLSFPCPARTGSKGLAGEIAISADMAAQNAVRLGHSVALEIRVLALHGILHLAGYDHERDNGEMARKEEKLRQALRLPSALIERSQGGKRKSMAPRIGLSRSRRSPRTA